MEIIKSVDGYQAMAERTMSKTRTPDVEIVTFGLGIVGEACEVGELVAGAAPFNGYVKEIGDVLWYVSGLCSLLDVKLSSIYGRFDWVDVDNLIDKGMNLNWDRKSLALRLCVKTGKVADYIKKVQGHGHTLDKLKLMDLVTESAHAILPLAVGELRISMEEIASANIDKLKKRYPNGFNEDASKNRTDKE